MTDDEVKDLAVINSDEYFKSVRETLYTKLIEKQNLRKVVALLYIFPKTPDEVEKHLQVMQSSSSNNCLCRFNIKILNLFDPEL